MIVSCKGECIRNYETVPILNSSKRWPKCRKCDVRINYAGTWCPCCRQKLSLRVLHTTRRSKDYVPALIQWSNRIGKRKL